MKIAVSHRTAYRYSRAVFLEPHVLRLRPRENATQRLLAWAVKIEPQPAGSCDVLDQDGNAATEAWFESETARLAIETRFEVETRRRNAYDFVLSDTGLFSVPAAYPAATRESLGWCLNGGAAGPAVTRLAGETAESAGRNTLMFLSELNARLYEGTRHIVRPTGKPMDPEETLARGEASCRDLAMVFAACCRAQGIAARFVSGYESQAAFHHAGQMHAWAEVYLPGGGWRGYDPSRGLAVAAQHVAVAASALPELAAPVTGTYRGAAESEMEVRIEMRLEGEEVGAR